MSAISGERSRLSDLKILNLKLPRMRPKVNIPRLKPCLCIFNVEFVLNCCSFCLTALVKQSCAMIEEAENLKTLVVENKELRQELDKLKADHEKSIAQILESSSMATDERDRKIAAQDQKISDLNNELCRERDLSEALRAELQSLREEKTKIDDVIFGRFHLSDYSAFFDFYQCRIFLNLFCV